MAPPPKKGSPFLKIIAIVLGILALITVAGIGSCIYIGYRLEHKAKQYVEELKAKTEQGQTVDLSKYESRSIEDCEFKDRTGFDEYLTSAAGASIPLKNGLSLVSIWTDPNNQYREVEVLLTVQGTHSSTVEITQQRLEKGAMQNRRNVCINDLLHARAYETETGTDSPETIPGTTMFSLSPPVFQDLKAGRPTDWTYMQTWVRNHKFVSWVARGQLTRVEPNDVPYSAIVNGKRTDLPTIHARATLSDKLIHKDYVYDAWFLDDPADPITLNIVNYEQKWHITFLKIDFPVEKKIEQDIAKSGCAAVYGIYFDFNSAAVRSESDPALKEIADALKNNPAWKLKIEGHTDNVGGDAYNMTLSTHRAEAVGQALEAQYHVPVDRLSSQGFGASKPKATNDTPEGRALNRRVEVCRQ